MPALNFPNNPAINDTYIAAGYTYKWDGTKWMTVQSGEKSMNQIMDEHKVGTNQHAISGVSGLSTALSDINSAISNLNSWPQTGSNVNGKWAKYENGDMVCEHVQTSSNGVTVADPTIFRNGSQTWVFPQVFYSTPNVSHSIVSGVSLAWSSLGISATTASQTTWCAWATSSNTALPIASLVARGRWKA